MTGYRYRQHYPADPTQRSIAGPYEYDPLMDGPIAYAVALRDDPTEDWLEMEYLYPLAYARRIAHDLLNQFSGDTVAILRDGAIVECPTDLCP